VTREVIPPAAEPPVPLSTRIQRASHDGRIARRRMAGWADETRGLEMAVDAIGDAVAARSRLQVREPLTYQPGSPHSWFMDLYKSERGNDPEARKRLDAHAREMTTLAPARTEARNRAAASAAERALTATPGERRSLEAFTGAGRTLFERRALTQVDSQGGYFIPPAWLIDRAVPPARAESALAAAVTTLPLPEFCDTVNLPRITTGTAAAIQQASAGPVTTRDLADAFVSSPVITIAGTADVSYQWLDMGSTGAGAALDALIWDDLQADLQLTLDGLLILGSGVNGQTAGLFPPQTTAGTSLAVYAPNGNTGSGQQWYYNGGTGTALGTTVAQCVSGLTRARGKRPSHLLTHSWVWDMITAQTDQQQRPYVQPKGPHPVPDDAEMPPGVVGYVNGMPLLGDLNVPTTFGGTVSPPQTPYLGSLNGVQYAGQPGTGASALYTPVVALCADDLFVFLGEPHMRLLSQVLAGSLAYRFQVHHYVSIIIGRYQALTSGTLPNSGGWAAGANSAYGVVTQQGSNSLLSITGQGF
jgi:HK97 family phage major capsid protein